MKMFRQIVLLWHRYVGLALALFLIVVGVTGSIKVFDEELDRLISPQWYAAPQPGVPTLDLATLAECAQGDVPPNGWIAGVELEPGRARVIVLPPLPDPPAQKGQKLDINKLLAFPPFLVYLDPWTGQKLGRRSTSVSFTDGLDGAHQFISSLHDRLALDVFGLIPGAVGRMLLGLVALLWTIDCFFATYLTLPITLKNFWARWKPSWLIKRGANAYRLNLDLHRASGLWLLPLLFVFAWSSVMLNLGSVHRSVSRVFFTYPTPQDEAARRNRMAPRPALSDEQSRRVAPLSIRETLAVGQRAAAAEAAKRGLAINRTCNLLSLSNRGDGALLLLRTSQDFVGNDEFCDTQLDFNGRTGEVYAFTTSLSPSGGAPSGTVVNAWLQQLHYAKHFGLAYKVLVCALGLIVAMLSVTGIYIWWKKRRVRKSRVPEFGLAEA
ncbi:MAG: PepSY-associated TM helix domain-containing protein [Vicinamibacterales bacterium]